MKQVDKRFCSPLGPIWGLVSPSISQSCTWNSAANRNPTSSSELLGTWDSSLLLLVQPFPEYIRVRTAFIFSLCCFAERNYNTGFAKRSG